MSLRWRRLLVIAHAVFTLGLIVPLVESWDSPIAGVFMARCAFFLAAVLLGITCWHSMWRRDGRDH